jgi:hypothetical protein
MEKRIADKASMCGHDGFKTTFDLQRAMVNDPGA